MREAPITECQWIGPEQDPLRDWPIHYCGKQTLTGKSYCHEHYGKMYMRGSSVNGKRREKEVEKEIAELKRQQEIEEIENA